MKNQLFCKVTTKATALVMGSLVAFSGQALASSSNNREFTDADALGNSESLIAQATVPLQVQERIALATSLAQVFNTLGNAISITNAAAIPVTDKIAIAQSLLQAFSIIPITTDDAAAIARSVSSAQTVIVNAQALAQSLALSPDVQAVMTAISQVQTATGNTVAIANSIAS